MKPAKTFQNEIKEINRLHGECLGSVRTSVQQAIRVGELLAGIKKKLGNRKWKPWLEANLEFNRMTAHRYMKCYDNRAICNKLLQISDAYKLLSGGGDPHVSNNSGNNEWYTPPEYIQAAKEVMGGIDTDPASSEAANKTVGAKNFYTSKDNGLAKEWNGRVWLNPPYAQPLISEFSDALVEKWTTGEITEACVLVNNATETEWFQNMLAVSASSCFVKSRVKFLSPEGEKGTPLQGQSVLYFGVKHDKFAKQFSKLGVVLKRVII